MRRIFLAIVLFSFYANSQTLISEELKPYVYDYIDVSLLYGVDVNVPSKGFYVVFDEDINIEEAILPQEVLGRAYGMYNDDIVYVIINKDMFTYLSEAKRKSLIHHELNHDIHNFEHVEDATHLMYYKNSTRGMIDAMTRVHDAMKEIASGLSHYK